MKKKSKVDRALNVVVAFVIIASIAVLGLGVSMIVRQVKDLRVPEPGTAETTGIDEPVTTVDPAGKDPDSPETDTPGTASVPDDTTVPFDPEDPVGNGDIGPDELPEDTSISVKRIEVETGGTEAATEPQSPALIEIVSIETKKAPEDDKPAEVRAEVINDIVIEKKEEAAKEKLEADPLVTAPATVIESVSVTVEEDKPVTLITETDEPKEDPEQNGTAPIYVNPSQGGANPFENGTKTQVDDHNSEEYVGEGGERPGEGIHF